MLHAASRACKLRHSPAKISGGIRDSSSTTPATFSASGYSGCCFAFLLLQVSGVQCCKCCAPRWKGKTGGDNTAAAQIRRCRPPARCAERDTAAGGQQACEGDSRLGPRRRAPRLEPAIDIAHHETLWTKIVILRCRAPPSAAGISMLLLGEARVMSGHAFHLQLLPCEPAIHHICGARSRGNELCA